MKVMFVQPPIEDFYQTSIRTYPLGLLYVAAEVGDLCEVSVVDARTGVKARRPEGQAPEGVDGYYRTDRSTPLSLFRKYRRFGMGLEDLRKVIAEERPDVLAISSLFTTYSDQAVEVSRVAKALNPGIVTVLGGTHPTVFPDYALSDPSVDFVIRGEGETPFRRLLERLSKGQDGRISEVCFREQSSFHVGPINVERQIDLLPDRSLVQTDRYRIGRNKYAALLTSRGCPNRCSFCGKPPVPYRKRSIGSIEADMADCLGRGIEAVDFQDDMLTGDMRFFHQVLELFTGQGLSLSAMNGIYTERLDEITLDRMYKAGFRRLNFSLVDTSDSLLFSHNRLGAASFVRLQPYLEESPFLVEVHFIVGLPAQTPTEVLRTIIFLMGRRLLLGPSIFYPAPNSPIFKRTVGEEWQPLLTSLRSSAMFPADPMFPRPTIYTLMKLVRFVNYIKGLLDREEIGGRLSDHLNSLTEAESIEQRVVRTLLLQKRFVWQDTSTGDFLNEPQDGEVVRLFFQMAKDLRIRGFRTPNTVLVDL